MRAVPSSTIPQCLCSSPRNSDNITLFWKANFLAPSPYKISISKLYWLPRKGFLDPLGLQVCSVSWIPGQIYMVAEAWKAKVGFSRNTSGKGTARALLRSKENIQSRMLSSGMDRFLINLATMLLQCCHSCCHLLFVPPKTQKENIWQCPLRMDLRYYPW